jgi:hypothetical protein
MRSSATYTMPTSLTSLRQLLSGFGDPSIFLPLCAAHEELDDDFMVPTIIFTLCGTPHSPCYDVSRYLQSLIMPMINAMPTPDFSTVLGEFKTATALKNIRANEKGEYKPSKIKDMSLYFVHELE